MYFSDEFEARTDGVAGYGYSQAEVAWLGLEGSKYEAAFDESLDCRDYWCDLSRWIEYGVIDDDYRDVDFEIECAWTDRVKELADIKRSEQERDKSDQDFYDWSNLYDVVFKPHPVSREQARQLRKELRRHKPSPGCRRKTDHATKGYLPRDRDIYDFWDGKRHLRRSVRCQLKIGLANLPLTDEPIDNLPFFWEELYWELVEGPEPDAEEIDSEADDAEYEALLDDYGIPYISDKDELCLRRETGEDELMVRARELAAQVGVEAELAYELLTDLECGYAPVVDQWPPCVADPRAVGFSGSRTFSRER